MGGAETSLLQLLASVRTAQPDWDLRLVLGEGGPFAAKTEALGIPTLVVPFPPALANLGDSGLKETSPRGSLSRFFTMFRALRQTQIYTRELRSAVGKLKPQLIHSTGFKMHLLALWARPAGIPVIWHIHDYVSSRPIIRRLLRWHSNKCAAVIVNSKSVREDVLNSCSNLPKVVAIYNSIDLIRFSPAGPTIDLDAAAELPATSEPTLRIGLPATFAKWKGHVVFLKALSFLPPSLPVRSYIIGGPIYQTEGSQYSLGELRDEVRKLGLSDRVGFTGFVDASDSAMRALDIIVHASTQPEPFGMVIVEAMACGKAVVASESSGASELFRNGQDVLAYPCGNAEELAKRLMILIADPKLRLSMGASGRHSVEGVLKGSRLASEVVAVYNQVNPGAASPLPAY
jgi:glycosyltransferase involved in cell wall biosynthesis